MINRQVFKKKLSISFKLLYSGGEKAAFKVGVSVDKDGVRFLCLVIFIYKQEGVLKFLYDNNVTVALEF